MSNTIFISEAEAAAKAGVSQKTLERFAEAGYLRRAEFHGMQGFWADELSAVFGIQLDLDTQTFEPPPAKAPSLEQEVGESCHFTVEEKTPPTPQPQKATITEAPPIALTTPVTEQVSNAEVIRLTHLVKLQEKLIEKLEEENKELKSERNWLRLRVEKFEEKGERDQLLLLSERQLLRTLTGAQKRSPIQTALEWLGFKTTDEKTQMLELQREAKEATAADVTPPDQTPQERKAA